MLYVIGGVLLIIMLGVFKKSGSFFKAFLTSALGGISSLCAVWAVNFFVPLTLGINLYSLVFSVLFSVPGVVLLLLVQTFIFR